MIYAAESSDHTMAARLPHAMYVVIGWKNAHTTAGELNPPVRYATTNVTAHVMPVTACAITSIETPRRIAGAVSSSPATMAQMARADYGEP